MKKIFLLPFLMFALPALASGQAMRHEESGSGNVEPEILRLENEWMSALVRRDAEVLERLMADDFLLLGEQWNGKRALAPKQLWIKNSLTTIEAKSFSFDNVKIQVRENVVVFHCLFTFEATNDGRLWGGTVRLTDVWVKDDGRWRVLARDASRPTQPQQSQ